MLAQTGRDIERHGHPDARDSRRNGLKFARLYTRPGVHPYDEIEWDRRTSRITNEKGEVIFEKKDVEVPSFWSMTATNVVVSKYFRGARDPRSPNQETSVRQMVDRVAKTIAGWGRSTGYFQTEEDAAAFEAELTFLLVRQLASFNSPVWFNAGLDPKPQCSACFINSVADTMDSILDLAKTEGLLFKHGSGTGSNLSAIRSSKERLSAGGEASGPVSFMRGYDAFAGVIKSGGKTRRAAKMVILNIDHPDIVDFIRCKEIEEKKAWALIDAGYDGSFNGEAYSSIFFQNSNNSVRVTDEFMKAVEEDGDWNTRGVLTGDPVERFRARDLMRKIAEAAHVCGDPGMQYHSTINDWHTCPNTAPINASNPCSEYMFLDDSACNLASLNLMKFRDEKGEFDVERFQHAVRILITAQEIIVDNASYPTKAIERNSHDYRPLGLGYANLGALLMARGVAYDSDEGRHTAAAITALMCGEAYRASAEIAAVKGPFKGYSINRAPMLRVIRKHRTAIDSIDVDSIDNKRVGSGLIQAATQAWDRALSMGETHGFRNSQVTVIAPTGTIGFMMDCDTTGVEPELALVKYKKLVGGGCIKIVNQTVGEALSRLGYGPTERKAILEHINDKGTIEGAPHIQEHHLPVFDCSLAPVAGKRSIEYMGHVRMMAAVQPFVSGAISKTVNMPNSATVEDIERVYLDAHEMGIKSIAIYRDGCKRTQPLSTKLDASSDKAAPRHAPALESLAPRPVRRRLPDERQSITHKFVIAGHEGYITVGMYEDGSAGEVFVVMAKEGSVVSGLMDSVATACSIALQYGVPLSVLVRKFRHTRFEPSGWTNNPKIPFAKSIMDYLFQWLGQKFLPPENGEEPILIGQESEPKNGTRSSATPNTPNGGDPTFRVASDAPPCPSCGSIMVRNGACHKCLNCGEASGCSG